MADDPNKEAREKQLAQNREASDRSKREGTERLSKGRPTPTQDENDRAKLGEHILDHEDDGSGPDPHAQKNLEAQHATGGYQTRDVRADRPGPHTTRATAHRPSSE